MKKTFVIAILLALSTNAIKVRFTDDIEKMLAEADKTEESFDKMKVNRLFNRFNCKLTIFDTFVYFIVMFFIILLLFV